MRRRGALPRPFVSRLKKCHFSPAGGRHTVKLHRGAPPQKSAPRCGEGTGGESKTAARVMTPKVNVMQGARRGCSYCMTTAHWAQGGTRALFLAEAAVMISAPWLDHSTGETPGGLAEAVCLPAQKVPFLTRGWTAHSETAPRCASHSKSAPHRQAAERLPPALSATLWTKGLGTGAQSEGGVGGTKLPVVAAPAVREPHQGRCDMFSGLPTYP